MSHVKIVCHSREHYIFNVNYSKAAGEERAGQNKTPGEKYIFPVIHAPSMSRSFPLGITNGTVKSPARKTEKILDET